MQCDLTYCLPILLRRSPPQNCVLHCRHLCPPTNRQIGCQGWWGGHPSRWSGSRREEGDKEEEEDVTIIDITPSQPVPAARKRSWGVEGPPGEGDHGLPPGGPSVTSPAGPGPASDGCPQALIRRGLGPDTTSVLRPQARQHTGAPLQHPKNLLPWSLVGSESPPPQRSRQPFRLWWPEPGWSIRDVGMVPAPAWGTTRPACGRSIGSPRRGRITPRPQPLIPAPPLFGRRAPQGAVAPDLSLSAPMGTGSAIPEALEERLLSEVPLERQSGRWHTQCTCPVVVWAPTESQFQEAHELLAAVGRWQVPAWDYVHNPDHPKWADKAKSMRFPCPQLGCPKVLSKYLDLKGHYQWEHIGEGPPHCATAPREPSTALQSLQITWTWSTTFSGLGWPGGPEDCGTVTGITSTLPPQPLPQRERGLSNLYMYWGEDWGDTVLGSLYSFTIVILYIYKKNKLV